MNRVPLRSLSKGFSPKTSTKFYSTHHNAHHSAHHQHPHIHHHHSGKQQHGQPVQKQEQVCCRSDTSMKACHDETQISSCWNCEERHHCTTLFCNQCHKIQPPPTSSHGKSIYTPLNHFQLFHVPTSFVVNENQLDAKYKQLQMLLHPDRFANKSEVERKISAVQSSLVTHAYETLKNQKLRAEYLLSLEGQKVDESDVDQMFLIEIMELMEVVNREELSQQDLKLLMKENEMEREQMGKEFNAAMSQRDFDVARKCAAKINYLVRVGDAIYERTDVHGG